MPPENFKKFESQLDIASKMLSLAFKVSILTGGAFLLFYCFHINYFPAGVSIGDGFLLILLAASFGVVYGFFVAGLTGVGICLMLVASRVQNVVRWIRKRIWNRSLGEPFKFASPDFNAFVLALVGGFLIYTVTQIEPSALWTLPLTSILLGGAVSVYQNFSSKLTERQKAEASPIQAIPVGKKFPIIDKEWLKKGRWIFLMVILVAPLLLGGISGLVLENGMRFANIRKANCTVLLRAPYSALVPTQFQSKPALPIPEFTTFSGIEVVFSGIGQKSVIEFRDASKKIHRLEVPNESIIVVPRPESTGREPSNKNPAIQPG